MGRTDEALAQFDALSEQASESNADVAARVALRRAQILAARRDWLDALQIAEQIATDYPDFAEQHEVDYLIGRSHASQARFDDARSAYGRVVNSAIAGKTETAAMAQWMIGESHFHQKNYRAAIREYLRVEILYAYPEWQAAALLQAAKCHEQLGEWNDAARLYDRLLANFGETTYAEEASRRVKSLEQRTSNSTAQVAAPPSKP